MKQQQPVLRAIASGLTKALKRERLSVHAVLETIKVRYVAKSLLRTHSSAFSNVCSRHVTTEANLPPYPALWNYGTVQMLRPLGPPPPPPNPLPPHPLMLSRHLTSLRPIVGGSLSFWGGLFFSFSFFLFWLCRFCAHPSQQCIRRYTCA